MTTKRMGRPIELPEGDTRAAQLRRLKGWSQEEMAAAFSVAATTVARWEKGLMEPQGPARKLLDLYLAGLTPQLDKVKNLEKLLMVAKKVVSAQATAADVAYFSDLVRRYEAGEEIT